MKISQLIARLRDDLEVYGDLDVRMPDHQPVVGALGAIDADDPARPFVLFLTNPED